MLRQSSVASLTPLAVGFCLLTAACARTTAVAAAPVSTPTTHPRTLPNDVRWFRTAAEYRALARQAYQVASDRMPELSRGLTAQRWAVILDADETVIDNSEYERRRFAADSDYTPASWQAWVDERAAPAIPGAVELTERVHALGGRVVIVTNRAEAQCAATRDNLRNDRIAADLVLCQPAGESDKNPRFARVQNGTAAPGMPALTVVAWFGDNILDFPHLSQTSRNDPAALADFGRRFFILPNPMYGSWQTNPGG